MPRFTVLVLSEDMSARALFRKAAEDAHGEVRFAGSLAEAADAIEGVHPDMVVFDADTYDPGSFARHIAMPARRATCFVALSSHRTGPVWQALYSAGFDRFVAKPVQLERVEEVLASLYDGVDSGWPLVRPDGKNQDGRNPGTAG